MSIKTIFPMSSYSWSLVSYVLAGMLIIFLLSSIPIMLMRVGKLFLIIELIFLILYLLSFFASNTKNNLLINSAFWTLFVCIPLAMHAYAINDQSILLKILHKLAYIQSIPLLLALYTIKLESTYSMSISYSLLLSILLFFHFYFKTNKLVDLCMALLSTLAVLLFGARGPILCVAYYIFIRYLFFMEYSLRRTISIVLIIIAIVVVLLFQVQILQFLDILLTKLGVHSRTLKLMLLGKTTNSSGRDVLFSYYKNLILEKPLFGWGLLGGWTSSGSGPHNMLIEYLLAFGIPLGFFLCFISVIFMIQVIVLRKHPHIDLILILSAYNLVMFFVSGNFLEKPIWFMFILLSVKLSKSSHYLAKSDEVKHRIQN